MSGRMAGLLAAIVWGVTISPSAAQSLGDVARQEATRRNEITAPARVLTNADLPSSALQGAGEAQAPTDPDTAGAGPSADGAATTPPDAKPKPKAAALEDDESGWRARAAQVNVRYAQAQAATRMLKALVDRLSLEMQASNPDIAARAAGEREALKMKMREAESAEIAALEAQQALQAEARAAGVLPAWIQ